MRIRLRELRVLVTEALDDDQARRRELRHNPTTSPTDALEEIVGLMPPDAELEGELADEFAYEGIIGEESVVFSGESVDYLLDSAEQVLVDELGYAPDAAFQGRSDRCRAFIRAGVRVIVDEIDEDIVERPMIYISLE